MGLRSPMQPRRAQFNLTFPTTMPDVRPRKSVRMGWRPWWRGHRRFGLIIFGVLAAVFAFRRLAGWRDGIERRICMRRSRCGDGGFEDVQRPPRLRRTNDNDDGPLRAARCRI